MRERERDKEERLMWLGLLVMRGGLLVVVRGGLPTAGLRSQLKE